MFQIFSKDQNNIFKWYVDWIPHISRNFSEILFLQFSKAQNTFYIIKKVQRSQETYLYNCFQPRKNFSSFFINHHRVLLIAEILIRTLKREKDRFRVGAWNRPLRNGKQSRQLCETKTNLTFHPRARVYRKWREIAKIAW